MGQRLIVASVCFGLGFLFTGCDSTAGERDQPSVTRSPPEHAQADLQRLIDNKSEALGVVLRDNGYFPGAMVQEDDAHDGLYRFKVEFSRLSEEEHRGELWTATLWANDLHTHEKYGAQGGGTVDIPMVAFIWLTFARQGSEGDWTLLVSDGLLFDLSAGSRLQSKLPQRLQRDLMAVLPEQRSWEDWYPQLVRAEAESSAAN